MQKFLITKNRIPALIAGLIVIVSAVSIGMASASMAQLGMGTNGATSSIYSIIGTDGFQAGDKVRRFYHFMQWNHANNEWAEIETQIIKNGDVLVEPSEPTSAISTQSAEDDMQFSGWVVTGKTPSSQSQYISDGTQVEFGAITDIDETTTTDETVYVYADLKQVYKAAFFDRAQGEGAPSIFTVLNSADYADGEAIDISSITETIEIAEGKAVTSWHIYSRNGTPYSIASVFADDKTSLKFSEINQTIFLYPEISDSHLVTFDKNDSTTNPNDKDTKSNASFTNSIIVAENVKINQPKNPTREGYEFGGWYENRECSGNPVDFATRTYTSDTTFYAKWVPNSVSFRVILWTETFNTEIGKTSETRPGQYYSFIETKTGSEKAGLTIESREDVSDILGELFTESQLSTWFPYHETPDLDDIDGELFIAGDGSTILNIYFNLKTYQLTFNANNGNAQGTIIHEGSQAGTYHASDYTINVKIGQDISQLWPTAAEVQDIVSGRNTYVFRGWTRSGSNNLFITKRDKMVKELLTTTNNQYVDTTFTASYDTNLRKDYVKYYLQNSSGNDYELSNVYTEYINANQNSNVQPKEIEGFTFVRNGENNGQYDSTLEAYVYTFYYDRNSYKIEFINYGEIDKEVDNVLHGADISSQYYVPERPTTLEEYYEFDGWYLDQYYQVRFGNGSFTGKTMHKDNLALYAKWTKGNIVIAFDGNGGTIDGEERKEYQIEAETKLSEAPDYPVRGDTWEFLGWYDENGHALDLAKPFTSDTTFRASWKSVEKFSIKYETPNDEAGQVIEDTYLYFDGATTSINKFEDTHPQSREGYNFIGWKYKINPDGKIYHENEMIEVDADRADSNNIVWISAVYGTETPIITTLTFDGNGGSHSGQASVAVDAAVAEYGNTRNNEWQALPADFFSRTRKTFIEWNTANDGSGTSFAPNQSIGVSATNTPNVLYAIWEDSAPVMAEYYVEHWIDSIDQDNPSANAVQVAGIWYELDNAIVEEKTGEIGTLVSASPKTGEDYAHYIYNEQDSTASGTVASDPNNPLRLRLLYNRETITINYHYVGNVPASATPSQATLDSTPSTAKYGSSFNSYKGASSAPESGYNFDGWYFDDSCTEPVGPVTVSAPFTVYGKFTPRDDLPYNINFYYQKAGVYPSTADKVISKVGSADEVVNVEDPYLIPDENHQNQNYQLDQDLSVLSGTLPMAPDAPLKVYFKQEFTVNYLKGTHGDFIDANDSAEEASANTHFSNIPYGTLLSAVAYNGAVDDSGNPLGKDGGTFVGWAADVATTLTNGEVIPAESTISSDLLANIAVNQNINLTAQWQIDDTPEEDDKDSKDEEDKKDSKSKDPEESGEEDMLVPNTGLNTTNSEYATMIFYASVAIIVILIGAKIYAKLSRKS